jgi:hypothetical protein
LAVACWVLVSLSLCATTARAQAIHEGKLTGTVVGEDQMVIPGATVEVSSPALIGGIRSATTSRTGTYVFLNLPIGRYKVTASQTGFKKIVKEDIQVSADTTVAVDFMLPVGGFEEVVSVTAASPRIDAKGATVDSEIDRDQVARLPTSRDAFYDLVLTAPGMFDSASSNSLASPTAYGSSTNENVFLINGVNATNPEAGSFGTLVNVNYDAVDEVRIVGLGAKAEYGSFSGVAVDVVTKSGSNAFHGTGAFYSKLGSPANNQPGPNESLGASWLYIGEGEQLAGDVKKDWETSLTLGGPVRKDKVWFFGAFDHIRRSTLPPRWSLQNESWNRYVDAKVSFLPVQKHLIWGAYHYENNNANGTSWGSEPAWDTSMSYGTRTVNNTAAAQWQWAPAGRTAVSAKLLAFWKNDKPYLPDNHADHPGYINWWKWADYGVNGAFPYVDNQKASRQTIQADLSHYTEGFLGQHDIKFGVQYTKGRGNRQEGYFQNYVNFLYPYRWTQNVEEMQAGYGDTGLLFYNYKDTINPFLTVRTADTAGAFFDDRWSPTKRLTITLGLRFDRMTTKYDKGKVYDFLTSPDQINSPTVLRGRASTGNIFDFKTWSPRLGAAYILTADNKTVARAAYGRYYMPLSIEYLRRFGPDVPELTRVVQMFEVGPWSSVDTNGDGNIDAAETRAAARRVYGLTPFSEEARTIDQSWTLNVADNLKDQFTDELSFNVEREVAKNLSVTAAYIYKHSANLFANVPINRVTGQEWQYDRIPFTTLSGQTVMLYSVKHLDYNADGVVDSADIAWIGGNGTSRVQNMPSFDGVKSQRNYHGLQLVVSKRYSDRWQALASFLYSNSNGMARRSLRQDVNVEGPMFWDDNWMGTLNQTVNNLTGPLPFTPKFEFKLSGSYMIPRVEVDVGGRLRVQTGRPLWQLEVYPQLTQWGGPADGVIDPGGTGQIVASSDPVHLPTRTLLDLHFDKVFKLRAHSVHLVVDGFNVLNSSAATDADPLYEYGKVTAIPASRRWRLGLKYQF